MEKIHITESRLAGILKVTPRYVRELFSDQRVKKGVYDFLPCLKQYIEDLQGKGEEVKLQRIKAETAQFKLDVMKKEYHHTDEIEMFLGDLIAKIKSKVLSIPNKGARLVAGETDVAKIESILKSFTDEILIELAGEKFGVLGEKDEE